jgi:hypothetical protein
VQAFEDTLQRSPERQMHRREYNLTRTHSGKYCYGKTPMQTFLDSAHLAHEKMLDSLHHPAPEPERSHAERSVGGGAAADAAA